MRINTLKAMARAAVKGAAVLLLGAGAAGAQTVSLTAAPSTATLPDGNAVHMWGYTCGAVSGNAACSALNPAGTSTSWSPVVITVPYSTAGTNLTMNLTNGLPAPVPTSLVIVGQIGGGLGTDRTTSASPLHDNQGTTWPIANAGPVFTPPTQGPRVQSFSTEVGTGATTSLTWSGLKPGTYLLESGTHPSIQAAMGLIGMLVVTAAPADATTAGTAYPGISYSADVPLLFSEIDPAQNNAVYAAVNTIGFSESATRNYSTRGQGVASINLTSGGGGYTSAPTVVFTGSGSGAIATTKIDTDPTSPTYQQVIEVDLDPNNVGSYTSAPTITFMGGGGTGASAIAALALNANSASLCSGGAAACYPSVVNYSPRYYLINGAAFDKTHPMNSLFAAAPGTAASPISGPVLVRLVNAGARMHIPAIVGSATGGMGGFSLIAEDGNALPGTPRVQSEVFMAAGKTYDVMIDTPAAGATALPIFDRQLSLSANSTNRDGGMLAYIGVNGSGTPSAAGTGPAKANPDVYNAVVSGVTLTVSDPGKGVIANDYNVYGVKVQGTVPGLTLNEDGTFTYTGAPTTFTYCGNGATSGPACAMVTLGANTVAASDTITVCNGSDCTFYSNQSKVFKVAAPGLLTGATDAAGVPLTVDLATVSNQCATGTPTPPCVIPDASGGFTYFSDGSTTPRTFTFQAVNSLGVHSGTAPAHVNFYAGAGLKVTVLDGSDKTTQISDYRWIIEEDRTFYVDPACALTPSASGCPQPPASTNGVSVNFGTNFHSSYMPVMAAGCTGDTSCENNQSVLGAQVSAEAFSSPADVPLCSSLPTGVTGVGCLDPNKHYYISVLPGDAAQPFIGGYAGSPTDCASNTGTSLSNAQNNWTTNCGHGMGGAPVAKAAITGGQTVTVITEPSPYPPATLTVFVFEDDFPLNGEHDAGGGIDVLSPNEPGLGGFQITLQDDAGGTGDATGTPTYDMFNMPLSNSLAGTIDPITGADACPLSQQVSDTATGGDSSQNGIVGMIITCPTYESDGTTLSPLAGQAVVKNLYQGRYGVVAMPGADRFARGEEWLQTNTLDGQKAHDSFMRIGEPAYFQEFGPAGYHVTIGYANPKIINQRMKDMCTNVPPDYTDSTPYCGHEVKGHVTTARMSRTPDERLYGSGDHSSYSFTQCYVSMGDPDGAEFQLVKCDADGNFDFTGVPAGNWKITTFDQWNDQVVDGISTAVGMCDPGSTISGTGHHCNPLTDMGEIAVHQWQANIYTRSFIDANGDGVSNHDGAGNDTELGLALAATNIRFRDGSYSNFNNTDLNGYAGFNEVFPLFNWYVIETDSTRYKNTGTHVVYDSGGPADGTKPAGAACAGAVSPFRACGSSGIADHLANTYEPNPLPPALSLPGSVYCADADCTAEASPNGPGIAGPPVPSSTDPTKTSTGRIDGPWATSYGWQGYSGQNSFLEFGKKPFAPGENGGIHGHVVYASTRPFDDPQLLLQLSWEPMVPHVTINLYKEGLAADGVTTTRTLIDHTQTTSFDDWAQGFRKDAQGNLISKDGGFVPNISCPGQATDSSDPFYFGLKGQPQWLDYYANGTAATVIADNAQYKCYDGMHNWNQLQPAPYDGMYSFPSITGMDPTTGKPTGTNCTACVTNPDQTDAYRYGGSTTPTAWVNGTSTGAPMLPDGKYVVELVIPPGYELVKEEDKNILIGDNFIAPVTQQFGGLGSIFILPDQSTVSSTDPTYNPNNPQNPTNSLGRDPSLPSHEGDTGSVETFWPCVGEVRTVPDFISLFPGSGEVAPFAGASRPLCDHKEVTLTDQTAALAKFYIFTETHTASHFTGVITDDFTAEFDPFSPQFGEKFGPAYLPVSFKDWSGNEISRVYTDAWGAYNGLNYSTWEVNPPNPTGYGPTMMVGCMNDAGPVPDPANPGQTIIDPLFQDGYSQFCYELPFMPAQTGYFDTPVVPTSAFAGGYNPPDCAYPNATPAIKEVDGDGVGPWVGGAAGSGALASINLTNGGSGYTKAPTLTIAAPGGGGNTTATAIAAISGSVAPAINVTNGGSGYTTTPIVKFVGGGGSGATATASITGKVSFVTVSAPGSGYTSAPGVTFSAPASGTTATGAAVISGSVASVSISSGGAAYNQNSASVTFSAPQLAGGVQATGSVTVTLGRITNVTINNPGSGYSSAPTVTFSPAHPNGATRAAATSTISGFVVAVNVGNPGSGYTAAPSVTFNNTGHGGTGAAAMAGITSSVSAVTLTAGGSGYSSAPQVQFIPTDTTGSGAAATATISASVVSLTLTNPGSGYSAANLPAVTFNNTGTGGTGAAATVTAASLSAGKLTITALGPQQVDNYEYSGPLTTNTSGDFTKPKATRTYSFGATAGTVALLDGLGVSHTLAISSWSGSQIVATIPNNLNPAIAACGATTLNPTGLQQMSVYGGSAAKCGQLVITTAGGQQSIDTVTVTVGGKSPTHVSANQTIQAAIDAAAPGDMIIVDPTCTTTGASPAAATCNAAGLHAGTPTQNATANAHQEMLLMWKPLRLQGVGAASSIIDANPHPAGRLDPWRREVVCLFGLALNGQPYPNSSSGQPNPFDSSNTFNCPGNLQHFSGGPNFPTMVVDRLPMEGILGWDTTVNGNLAEQLIEPSLMGAYEGAGITVLAKGVNIPAGATDVFGSGAEAAFPAGSVPLTGSTADCAVSGSDIRYPSNFQCNPSSIDGLTIQNSSQGGGGILVHAWAHNLQIANNRVQNNQGTMSGGITVGQGEHTDVPLMGGTAALTTVPPGSCLSDAGQPTNLALPFCYDLDVNVHHNMVTRNSSLGDELFTSTPAGAGGVTICNGSDYYKFNYNWVCGNLSTGDGAGVAHVGFSYYGDIEHNTILFNQTTNPSIVTNGGGLLVMGAPDPDPPCSTNDQDCLSAPNTITPSDGIGPGLQINANYIVGNSADSGSGGGLRFQHANGTDVVNFPSGNSTATVGWPTLARHSGVPTFQAKTPWNAAQVTNNIIANNVAGWDGGGISLLDALNVNIINNTITSNNTTASSGVLFQTLFAPLASSSGDNCTINSGTQSCPQPAGLVSVTNSAILIANLPTTNFSCPAGHGGTSGTSCASYSIPVLGNNLFWKNRPLMIGLGGNAGGLQNQQNMIVVYDPTFSAPTTMSPTQLGTEASTGACDAAASSWDIGVRGDVGPNNHTGGTLAPFYSVLTNTGGLAEGGTTNNNVYAGTTSPVNRFYCNGSRVPIESGGSNWQLPPGTNESNALPTPVFNLTAGGTVDEGNNWVNLTWGPLWDPLSGAMPGVTTPFALDATPSTAHLAPASTPFGPAPTLDFYGHTRGTTNVVIGAIESAPTTTGPTLNSITPASGSLGTTVSVVLSGSNLATVNSINDTTPGPGHITCTVTTPAPTATTVNGSCVIPNGATTGIHTINVGTPALGTSNTVNFRVLAGTLLTTGPTPNLTGGGTGTKTGVITVSNTATGANAGPITLTAAPSIAKVGGTGNGTFSIVAGAGTTCVNGTVLNSLGTCMITVRYSGQSNTAVANGRVTLTDTGLTTATQAINFNAN